jgi:galactokinase/mevalonate kinase-like predicted kinase
MSQNILNEKVLELDCHNCLIQGAQNRLVAAIGLDNLVVVDTEDAVLVSHLDKTHQIKGLLEKINKKLLFYPGQFCG